MNSSWGNKNRILVMAYQGLEFINYLPRSGQPIQNLSRTFIYQWRFNFYLYLESNSDISQLP
jgi:hypothetical protein